MHINQTTKTWNDIASCEQLRYLIEYLANVLEGKIVYGTSHSFKETNLTPNTLYHWMVVPSNIYHTMGSAGGNGLLAVAAERGMAEICAL